MSGKVMICLVGEQTIPNLLAVLHYKPAAVVLVHSDRTERHATNFARVISANTSSQTELCPAAAYDVAAAATSIRTLLAQAQWRGQEFIFNLTGGTKAMVLAGYQVAAEHVGCKLIYVELRGIKSYCYEYTIEKDVLRQQGEPAELSGLLTIPLYLQASGLNWKDHNITDTDAAGTIFQRQVEAVLLDAKAKRLLTDVLPSQDLLPDELDADVLVLLGNRLGVVEIKQRKQKNSKNEDNTHGSDGIEHLLTLTEQRYLGTFTVAIHVGNLKLGSVTQKLANARKIAHIQLGSWDGSTIDDKDKEKLVEEITVAMGGASR